MSLATSLIRLTSYAQCNISANADVLDWENCFEVLENIFTYSLTLEEYWHFLIQEMCLKP